MNSDMKFAIIILQIIIIYLLLTKSETFNDLECKIPPQNPNQRNIIYDTDSKCAKYGLCPNDGRPWISIKGVCHRDCAKKTGRKCTNPRPIEAKVGNTSLCCADNKFPSISPPANPPKCVIPTNNKTGLNVIYEEKGNCDNYALCPNPPYGAKNGYINLSPIDNTEIDTLKKDSPEYIKEYRGCYMNCIAKPPKGCPSKNKNLARNTQGQEFCCEKYVPSPPTPLMEESLNKTKENIKANITRNTNANITANANITTTNTLTNTLTTTTEYPANCPMTPNLPPNKQYRFDPDGDCSSRIECPVHPNHITNLNKKCYMDCAKKMGVCPTARNKIFKSIKGIEYCCAKAV